MTSRLWRFALDFYGRPGVATACLLLQDEAGVDVIQLIAVLYADRHGRALDAPAIDALGTAMTGWREGVVLPLRATRRFLKQAPVGHEAETERLRQATKAVELEAEKLQLALAEAWLHARDSTAGLPLRAAIEMLLRPEPTGAAHDRIGQAVATILDVGATIRAEERPWA